MFSVDFKFDTSHGCSNDIKLAVKAAQLWPHQLMMVAASSAPFGPFGQGIRAAQLEEGLREYFDAMSPTSCLLFAHHVRTLLAERGEVHRMTEPGIATTLWEELQVAE